ncbi:MAG: DUF1499 domain-containing protein [Gemmatimonadota bacterium]|nr:DUF1499 domain-containing protein [Gemmatimonadota bacterium]
MSSTGDRPTDPPPPPEDEDPDERPNVPGSPSGASVERSRSRLALAVLALALLVVALGALSGFGSRWGLWNFRTGFTLLRWSAYGAIVVAVLTLPVLWLTRPGAGRARDFLTALVALVVSVPVFGLPLTWRARAGEVPPIHDITTDTNDPPEFVAVAPLRADAPNPVEYPGPEVAAQQRRGYPDIRPVVLDAPLSEAYETALDAAHAEGWEIVGSNLEEGRIEATDRTFWFGFRDDVVIRLTPNGNRTIVDVRSKSRVGGSDVGTNARRIRSYLERLGG